VSGTFVANADGSFTDNTTTTGTETFSLAPACLVVSSTPIDCAGAEGFLTVLGYSAVSCVSAKTGGCNCTGTVQQMGGMGAPAISPPAGGSYTTSADAIQIPEGTNYAYCASGGTLTVTPQTTGTTTTGTIALRRESSTSTTTSGSFTSSYSGNGSSASSSSSKSTSTGSTSGTSASSSRATGPCDIFAAAGNPCVAAHSTVRALLGSYGGKLYQVRRNSDNTTQDVGTTATGGFASTAAQDTFCAGTTCVITVVYDQSGKGNDLWYQGSTMVPGSTSSSASIATTESLNISGNKVYSLYIKPGNSYWVDASKSGIALGSSPEGLYMVTSGTHYNGGCCFDYGNSESDRKADGAGAMDAINFSSITAWGTGAPPGPWVMADLEYGVFSQGGSGQNKNDLSMTNKYVTAMLKNNGTTEFALKGADAQSGGLTTFYKGALPGGWSPMKKQGAIVLGSGGDCCKPGGGANDSQGTFYEGAIVTGYPADATDDAIQSNIVAAGYGQ
jgi:hypothetical protein